MMVDISCNTRIIKVSETIINDECVWVGDSK